MTRRRLAELTLILVEIAVLGGIASAIPLAFEGSAREGPTFALAGVIVVSLHVQFRLRPRAAGGRRTPQDPEPSQPFRRLSLLQQRFEHGWESPAAFNRLIVPLMRQLAAGRLARRGVDPDQTPDRARDLVGADAFDLIYGPPAPAPATDRVGSALQRIEEL